MLAGGNPIPCPKKQAAPNGLGSEYQILNIIPESF